ncbi:kinetochore protein-like protein nuf2 [Amylocarpus encephaloides]|uniref:Probable kinetochore protein NUF2 n=1 Tax=Amylocarpus encephaloides TaxID=45428 RepID=A0A9P7YM99_9HELO|nr:kinetochore protein-like protein nuf2 [Amylocarpus encephaloides]
MAYSSRMSIAPNSQPQNRGRKKEEETDAFMRLPDKEIVGCISDIGVPITVADLHKPNPVQIQMIYECFVEVVMSTSRETVDPAMRAAAEDICGEYMEVIPGDTRNLMGFFVSLRQMLLACGIADFSFQDLYKPTHDRMVKIFSYIINFVRFRESQAQHMDEQSEKPRSTKNRIETLYMENQEMEDRLEEMKRNRKAMEVLVAEKVKRNENLKKRLLTLRQGQEQVTQRFENVRTKKGEMTAKLEDKTATTIALRQESAKLRPYVLQSPAALQASLTELSNALNAEKIQIDTLDRRARGLQTSTDTFQVVSSDVASCIKILEDISVELDKESEENVKIAKQRETLGDRSNNVREVERTEGLLQRQLSKWMERTDKLRESSAEKNKSAKTRMDELRAIHRQLTDERSEKGREMERRRVRIEQTEKKMVDLKENIENEVHNAHDEFMKMDSHIKLYITEMEPSL